MQDQSFHRDDRAGVAGRRLGHRHVAVRDVRRDRLGHQGGQPATANVHDRTGQWLWRLSADGRAPPAWRLRNLARPLQLFGSRGRSQNPREDPGTACAGGTGLAASQCVGQ